MKSYRPVQCFAALLTLGISCPVHAQAEGVQAVDIGVDAIKWMSPSALPGVQLAWLTGGDTKPGLYELRVRLAPGAVVPPHTHPDARCATVLSGELYAGHGDTVEPGNAKKYAAGSFHCVPAGVPHYVFAKDGEVMFQDSGVGPTGLSWVKK